MIWHWAWTLAALGALSTGILALRESWLDYRYYRSRVRAGERLPLGEGLVASEHVRRSVYRLVIEGLLLVVGVATFWLGALATLAQRSAYLAAVLVLFLNGLLAAWSRRQERAAFRRALDGRDDGSGRDTQPEQTHERG